MADNRDGDDKANLIIRSLMYTAALGAGVALILVGHTSPLEASGYVSPFIAVFENRAAARR
ncbi:hypothetical protein ABT173_14800 [Streptomyces sp. NPDC001795]|uniref:hypothetical protein n=1 Tax=Streptomyces sp. NPDC001795 TaxID=3154525 RepID=UPI0033245C3A